MSEAMSDKMLTDAECDAIRNACNKEWQKLPFAEYHNPPWEHRLIRAGAAAAEARLLHAALAELDKK